MTGHTDRRLSRLYEVLGDSPMRIVAGHASLDDGRMFKDPRALHISVTRGASIVLRRITDFSVAVGVVARNATQCAFANRMMGWHLECGFDTNMATHA